MAHSLSGLGKQKVYEQSFQSEFPELPIIHDALLLLARNVQCLVQKTHTHSYVK